MKTVGGLAQVKVRGLDKVRAVFIQPKPSSMRLRSRCPRV